MTTGEVRMTPKRDNSMKKVLLTSVCRPLGERYGDAPSVGYELLFGQVTRAQGNCQTAGKEGARKTHEAAGHATVGEEIPCKSEKRYGDEQRRACQRIHRYGNRRNVDFCPVERRKRDRTEHGKERHAEKCENNEQNEEEKKHGYVFTSPGVSSGSRPRNRVTSDR